MHFFHRLGPSIAAITVLIGLSVLAVVSLGEGFKFLGTLKESVSLRKRDGTTITFILPWKSALGITPEAKAISPVLGGLLGDVTNVASAILDNGYDVASSVSEEGNLLQSKAKADVSTAASVVLDGGVGIVASIMSEVNSMVNDATGVIGGVVGDATSVVGVILGGNTSGLNTANSSTTNVSGPAASSEPQELLPQSNGSMPTSAFPHNITSAASLPLTLTSTAGSFCPSATTATATTTITPCCPDPTTVTSTVTETWHSTHYDTTATLYSFMSLFTITFTQTVSVCPISSPYIFAPNATAQAASLTQMMNVSSPCSPTLSAFTHPCPNLGYPCSECSGGFFCPPPQTPAQNCPCGLGWACAACTQTFFCPTSTMSLNPVPTIVALMTSLEANATSSSVICPNGKLARRQQDCAATTSSLPSTMASFTASLPSPSQTSFSMPTLISTTIASIICANGSLVVRTEDCLSGPLPSASSSSAPPIASILSTIVCADGSHVLSSQGCLSGMTSSSLLQLGPSPTPYAAQTPTTVSDVTETLPSILTSAIANVALVFSDVQGLASGDLLSTLLSDATSAIAGINSAPSIVGITLATGSALAGVNSGSAVANSGISKVVDHIGTVVNGVSMILPIVTTVLNGIPTRVPVLDMLVNGVVTGVPVVNGAGLLVGLGSGAGLGLKERRRGVKRIDGIETAVGMGGVVHCEVGGEDGEESCIWFEEGRGPLLERERGFNS